jgi:Replication protein
LRKCGKIPHSDTISLRRDAEGRVGVAGLCTCGSVWACPVDNAKILALRQEEVRAASDAWLARGGRLAMLTLTMRHRRGDGLTGLWGSLSKAWGSVTSGKVWQREQEAHGAAGWLKVVEVTHGANGWHVHIHALLFINADETSESLSGWKKGIFSRWNGALKRAGLASASMAAQSLVLFSPGSDGFRDYFTKAVDLGQKIALEFTNSAGKKSRAAVGGRTQWDILDDVIALGDADALDLWNEFERASKGKRQMTWSKGLRDDLGLSTERTDEEIAEEELGDRSDDVISISREGWQTVFSFPELVPLALEVLEVGGIDACLALLWSAGVDCVPARDRGGT